MAQGTNENAMPRSTADTGTSKLEGSESSVGQENLKGVQGDRRSDMAPADRRRRIAEAAYYRAERRGFAPGSEDADWLEAEQEIGGQTSIKVDELNQCLRSELSAIETYQQALERNRAQYGREAKFERLTHILNDHREAAAHLRTIIVAQDGTPSTDSGAWGVWSKSVMGAAKLFGDKAALKALKQGEESGLAEYQRVARDAGASTENVVSAFIARQESHIQELGRLIESA